MNNTVADFEKGTRGKKKGECVEEEGDADSQPRCPLYRLEPEGSLLGPAADKSTVLEYRTTKHLNLTHPQDRMDERVAPMEWTIGKANAKAAKKVECERAKASKKMEGK